MKLHTDKEIINSLSVKHRLNPEVIENIIEHSLKSIKECISMEDMPNILIHNWGRFKPNKKSLDVKFYKTLQSLEINPETIEWNTIKYMLKAYDRIIKEDNLESSVGANKIREIINNRNEEKKE
jgi:nucleoid DNA-binding protein